MKLINDKRVRCKSSNGKFDFSVVKNIDSKSSTFESKKMPIKNMRKKSKKLKQHKATVCEYSNSNQFIVTKLSSNINDMFVAEKEDHIECNRNNVPNESTNGKIDLILLDDNSIPDSFEENGFGENAQAGCDINLKTIQTKENLNLINGNSDKHIQIESNGRDSNDNYVDLDPIVVPKKLEENNKQNELMTVNGQPISDINSFENSKIENLCNGTILKTGYDSTDNVKLRLRKRKEKRVSSDLSPSPGPEKKKKTKQNTHPKKIDVDIENSSPSSGIKFNHVEDDSNKSNEIDKPSVKVDNEPNKVENVEQKSILERKNNEKVKKIENLKATSTNDTSNAATNSNNIVGIRRSQRKVHSLYSETYLNEKRKIKQEKSLKSQVEKLKPSLVEKKENSIFEEESGFKHDIVKTIDDVKVKAEDEVKVKVKQEDYSSIDETIDRVIKYSIENNDSEDDFKSKKLSKNGKKSRFPNGPYVRIIIKKDKKFEQKLKAMKDEKSRYIARITDSEHYQEVVINKPEDLTRLLSKNKKQPRKEKPIAAVHKKMRQSMIDTGTLYDTENWCCSLCKRKTNESDLGYLYGPYYDIKDYNYFYKNNQDGDNSNNYPVGYKPREYWFHEDCFIWINIPKNRLIYNFIDAYAIEIINEYMETECGKCKKLGASIMCKIKPCKLALHYPCAQELDFSFEEEKCRILCPIHYQEMMKDIPPEDKHPGLL